VHPQDSRCRSQRRCPRQSEIEKWHSLTPKCQKDAGLEAFLTPSGAIYSAGMPVQPGSSDDSPATVEGLVEIDDADIVTQTLMVDE